MALAMKSHICDNEVLVAKREACASKNIEKQERNRRGLDQYEQIITRPLFQCVKSVTLQRWTWQGRDQ